MSVFRVLLVLVFIFFLGVATLCFFSLFFRLLIGIVKCCLLHLHYFCYVF